MKERKTDLRVGQYIFNYRLQIVCIYAKNFGKQIICFQRLYRFTLGTRVLANHYIQQFTEIFTEEGRKNVRIKHVVPGQVPRVTCTPGMQRAHQQVRTFSN